MIDRQKLETVLSRRFPDASTGQIAATANAIMGLGDDWEEIGDRSELGYRVTAKCAEFCVLAGCARDGGEFRLFRRRHG